MLEDGPPRLLAVPSSFGGWTLLSAEEGLSPIPAATLLQRPFGGRVRPSCNIREGHGRTLFPWRGRGDCKTFQLNLSTGELTVHCLFHAFTFLTPLNDSYLNVGRGTPSTTCP